MVLTRRQAAAGHGSTTSQQSTAQSGSMPLLAPVVVHTGGSGSGGSVARQTRSSVTNSAPALLDQPSKTNAAKSEAQTGKNSRQGNEISQNNTSLPVTAEDAAVPIATTSEPAPKRRKTARGTTKQTKEMPTIERRVTRSMRLHAFIHLPLDVILEVFCHLSPKDLLTIARTSKWLRGTVFAKRNAGIWRESREQFGVPEPAEGFSEPRWAALLFDRECQVCWKSYYLPKIRWNLLKRVDEVCFHARTERADGRQMRLLTAEAKDYVPWGHYDIHSGKRFWTGEVIALRKTWDKLKEEAENPAGRKAFHEWKKESRDRMRAHHKNIATYKRWDIMNDTNLKKHAKDLEAALAKHDEEVHRMEAGKASLMEHGYAAIDIELSGLVIDTPSFNAVIAQQNPGARYNSFGAAMPTIRKILDRKRNARLAFQNELVNWARWDIFTEVYDQYVNTLGPFEQIYCPPASALRRVSDVDKLLEGLDFKPVVEDMQRYIDAAQSSMKQALARACSQSDRKHSSEPWSLAKNVFQRRWHSSSGHTQGAANSVRVGWDMIATNRSKGRTSYELRDRPGVFVYGPKKFELNVQSSRNSEQLIAMAGLPRMVTVDEVDAADPRFACKNKADELTVYTWRAALLHMFKRPSHKMRLATEQEAIAAKENDRLARAEARAWSCNHCTQYLEASQAGTKQAVLEHLLNIHGVMNPEMPTDYFVNERCRYTYEVTYLTQAKDHSASRNTGDMEPVILNGCTLSSWGTIGGRVGVLGCVMSGGSRRGYP